MMMVWCNEHWILVFRMLGYILYNWKTVHKRSKKKKRIELKCDCVDDGKVVPSKDHWCVCALPNVLWHILHPSGSQNTSCCSSFYKWTTSFIPKRNGNQLCRGLLKRESGIKFQSIFYMNRGLQTLCAWAHYFCQLILTWWTFNNNCVCHNKIHTRFSKCY